MIAASARQDLRTCPVFIGLELCAECRQRRFITLDVGRRKQFGNAVDEARRIGKILFDFTAIRAPQFLVAEAFLRPHNSEARCVGKEWVSSWRSRCSTFHEKNKTSRPRINIDT